MARNDGIIGRNIAIDDMQVSAANATGKNLDQHFIGTRHGHGALDRTERPTGTIQLHRMILFPVLVHPAVNLRETIPPGTP